MITPDEIEKRVAAAFGRNIQDSVFGNVVNTVTSPLPYHIPVKIEGQEELYHAPYDPFLDATKLANNTGVELRYNRDGVLALIDSDAISARASYSVPPTHNFILQQHTHEDPAGGGQLDASSIFNQGAVPVGYGGTNIVSYAVGDLLYASAAGVLSKLAVGSNGNVYHVAGGLPVSGTLNLSTANLSGLLAYARGGLNADVSGITTGALLVKGASAASGLAPGTSGNIAQSNGSIWQSVAPSFAASVITSGQLVLERGGTEADLSATGAGHLIQATTGAAVSVIKDNFAATAAPNPATDDNTAGYAIGSLWLDTTNDDIYMAIDVSTGAAVWEQLNATSGGSSPFTTTSNVTHLVTPTDTVTIGSSSNLGKLAVVGDVDEVQLYVQAHDDQSAANVVEFRDLSNNVVFALTSDNQFQFNGSIVQLNGNNFLDGSLIVNTSGGDNDTNFEGMGDANLFYADASTDRIGIGTNTPTHKLHLVGAASLDGAVTINETGADADTRIEGDTDTDLLKIDAGLDMIGVSEGTPTALLHVGTSTTARASMRMTTGAAPTSPNDGDIWNDSTQKSFKKRINGLSLVDTQTLFSQINDVSVASTTSETTLKGTLVLAGNDTLPADFWTVGKTFTFFAAGLVTVSSGTPTAILRIKYGSVALRQFTTPTLSGSFIPWFLSGSGTCRSVGAVANLFTSGNLITNGTNTPGNTNATINTTTSNVLDLTIQPSTTNVTWTCGVFRIVIDN